MRATSAKEVAPRQTKVGEYLMSESSAVIRERRKRERDQRIQSILDAAKSVFFSKGYLKATMDEIALEAKLSKPTIYLYFKTKDDLYFSLMLPVVEDIGRQLERIEKKLAAKKYLNGASLLHDLCRGFVHSYEMAPDTFKIVQLFQQTNLVSELSDETGTALDAKGRANFEIGRRILTNGIAQGLIRPVDVQALVDVIWGMVVGIIQLEEIKSYRRNKGRARHLQPTLALAEKLIIDALTARTTDPV